MLYSAKNANNIPIFWHLFLELFFAEAALNVRYTHVFFGQSSKHRFDEVRTHALMDITYCSAIGVVLLGHNVDIHSKSRV